MKTTVMTFIQRYRRSEDGATMLLFGLVFLVLIAAAGLAVDYGRAQMVQSKMQSALDAAALAAATVGNNEPTEARKIEVKQREANKFMEANFPTEYMNTLYPGGSNQYITELKITQNGDGLSLTARGDVKNALMQVVGFDTIDVAAHTEIAIETSRFGLEVALVLDNTGSMATVSGGESRMTALKRSAKALVDDIYDKFDPNKTYVGIVPFSRTVKIGAAKRAGSQWKRNPPNNVPVGGNVNCIYTDARYGGKDDTPSRDISWIATDQIPVGGKAKTALFYNASNDNNCGNVAMTAMTNKVADIKAGINSMITSGNTRVDLGAVWGWRMLSPSWRGFWAHSDPALPLNYNTKDSNKVAIILTDGENTDDLASTVTKANNRLSSICNKMKAQNIVIYTVTLHLDNAGTRALMRNCATSTQHYFHVPPGQTPDDAFDQIAQSLANLRISK